MFEEALGTEHYEVGALLHTLAAVHSKKGQLEEAESTYRRALAIKENALGAAHPDLAATLNNLALIWHKSGRYELARPAYRRCLALIAAQTGEAEHPLRRACLHNLTKMLAAEAGRGDEVGGPPP